MSMPYHILADKVAERVIVVGDPNRAKFIAERLEDSKLVNDHRGLLTYNGKWKGVEVTVSTHGMGGPGAAIIFEELIQLGAKVMVRYGTTGGIRRGVKVGDYVIPTAAYYYHGGLYTEYFGDISPAPAPSIDVAWKLYQKTLEKGERAWAYPIISSDAFYAENRELVERWASYGPVSVEMECATLFVICTLRRIKSGALLLVNGSHVEPVDRLILEETMEKKLWKGAEIILDTLAELNIEKNTLPQ
ncbi:MAG: nucleoside phosphorylase [Thermoprotei archaeon]|nr:MAG: nucleoside phosphorylase [Thermoprotei archaeon]